MTTLRVLLRHSDFRWLSLDRSLSEVEDRMIARVAIQGTIAVFAFTGGLPI